MRFVSTERARPGMVLAAPVSDRRGRLLIPAGASLTERHIEALHLWGVPHIDVTGEGRLEQEPSPLPPGEADRLTEIIDARFGNVTVEHPFLAALRECALERAVHAARAGVGAP